MNVSVGQNVYLGKTEKLPLGLLENFEVCSEPTLIYVAMLNDNRELKYVDGIIVEFDLIVGNTSSLTLHMHVFK